MTESAAKEMTFLEHLEELRWRLIKSLAAVIVGAVITFFFVDRIIEILVRPTQLIDHPFSLQVLTVQGMFMVKWGLAFVGGVVLAIPVLTYQLWKFIAPGLYATERRYVYPVIIFTYFSFVVGIVFAYFVIIPFSLNFFSSMGYGDIQNNVSIKYYLSFMTWIMLGTGLIFELPIASYLLAVIGFLTPEFMRTYRRHAIVIIMVLSAIITPPDPVSMIVMTIPLMCLYEISIGVAWLASKRKTAIGDTSQ